jgi:malate dehydrogenase (oxaloacetate-decarboxylating)
MPRVALTPKCRLNADCCHETKARGLAVLNSPLLNKGTAFTAHERKTSGLIGLLPPDIGTLAAQVKLGDIVQQVEEAMWQPEYRRRQAS